MTPTKYAPFFALIQSVAASPPGAWFFAHTLHHFVGRTGGPCYLPGRPVMRNQGDATIRRLIADQQDAWNRADAGGFGARFHEEGTFTNVLGDVSHGRAAFIERHAFIFGTIFKASTVRLEVRRVHFPVDDVAVVDIDSSLSGFAGVPPGVSHPADGILRSSLLEVFVRNSAGWWIAAFHNVDVKARAQVAP